MTLPFSSPELRRLLEHQGFVQRLARQLCLDESSAQDLEQETWLAALRYPPDTEQSPKAWLRTVMRNLHFRRYRRSRTQGEREAQTVVESTRRVSQPEEEVAASQARERMGAALARLPEQYRVAVVLRFEEGLPPRSIGERLGIDTEQARWRVRRGVEILRSDLDRDTDRRDWMSGLAILATSGGVREGEAKPAAFLPVAAAVSIAAALLVWLVNFAGTSTPHPEIPVPETPGKLVELDAGAGNRESQEATVEVAPTVATYIEPSEFVDVSGTVIGPKGVPISGARLRLVSPDGWTVERVGTTNAQGQFSLTKLPRGHWLVAAKLKRRSWQVLLDGPTIQGDIEVTIDETLEPRTGQVFNDEGVPVPGAMVIEDPLRTFLGLGVDGLLHRRLGSEQAKTDFEGRFTLLAMPETWDFEARAEGGGWRGHLDWLDRIKLGEIHGRDLAQREIHGQIALGPGERLVCQAPDYIPDEMIIPVRTDGSFHAKVPAGTVSLHHWIDGSFVEVCSLPPGVDGDVGPLRARVRGSAELTFHGAVGRLGWVTLWFQQEGESPRRWEQLPVGRDSKVQIGSLPVGTWSIRANRFGYLSESFQTEISAEETATADVFLRLGARVYIRLIIDDPLPDAEEMLSMALLNEAGEEILRRNRLLTHGASEWLWQDTVEPGDYRIVVTGSHGARGEGTLSLWPDHEDLGPKGVVTEGELILTRSE